MPGFFWKKVLILLIWLGELLLNSKEMIRICSRWRKFQKALTWCLFHQESEEFLSSLVVNKTIYAKVDRMAGIINFQRPKDPNDLLNDWSHKLNSLMSLVNKTTHLIAKEEMIHNLQWNGNINIVHYFVFCFIFVCLFLSFCGNVFEYTVYWRTVKAALFQCHIIGKKQTICST